MTLPNISQWDPDDDPITRDQVRVLYELLNGEVSELALEGFLIVASRLVDEFGGHRTTELSTVFRTHTLKGQKVLHQSLEFVRQWVGGYEQYCQRYPVTIIPPRLAFPPVQDNWRHCACPVVYRVLDSKALACPSKKSVKDYTRFPSKNDLCAVKSRDFNGALTTRGAIHPRRGKLCRFARSGAIAVCERGCQSPRSSLVLCRLQW